MVDFLQRNWIAWLLLLALGGLWLSERAALDRQEAALIAACERENDLREEVNDRVLALLALRQGVLVALTIVKEESQSEEASTRFDEVRADMRRFALLDYSELSNCKEVVENP